MRIYRLIARIRSTSACVSLITSQDVTLPLVASSQPPVYRLGSVTFSTGPRTWASILQSVTTDPGPGWANPVKTPVICKIITSFRLCLQTGPTKRGCSEEQSYSLTGCSALERKCNPRRRRGPASFTHWCPSPGATKRRGIRQWPAPWSQPVSIFVPGAKRNASWMCPNYWSWSNTENFQTRVLPFFFFSFPQTAVESAVLAVQMGPIALYVPDVNRCALSMTSLGQPPSQNCCWWVETTWKEKQMWQCSWLTQQHRFASSAEAEDPGKTGPGLNRQGQGKTEEKDRIWSRIREDWYTLIYSTLLVLRKVSPSFANLWLCICTHIHGCIYLNAEAIGEMGNVSLRVECRLLAGVQDFKGSDL